MTTNNTAVITRGEAVPGRDDRGFTLVELLIVIVILGILATVVVFAVRGITDRGEESSCAADRRTLAGAVEAYFAFNSVSVLPDDGDGTSDTALVTAGFIRGTSSKYSVLTDGSITPLDSACPA